MLLPHVKLSVGEGGIRVLTPDNRRFATISFPSLTNKYILSWIPPQRKRFDEMSHMVRRPPGGVAQCATPWSLRPENRTRVAVAVKGDAVVLHVVCLVGNLSEDARNL